MKNFNTVLVSILFTASFFVNAYEPEDYEDDEPATEEVEIACEMVICLQDEAFTDPKVTEACKDAQERFFEIIDYDGIHIDVGGTVKKRYKQLSRCEGVSQQEIEIIIATWGAVIDPI